MNKTTLEQGNGTFPFLYTNDSVNSSTLLDAYNNVDICLRLINRHRDFTQLVPVTAIIVSAYVLIMIVAILGNVLVISTVWRNSHMHTVTNYYIVNLAVSDLLVACLVMPLKLLEYTADCQWQVFRSNILCSVLTYLLPIFVFASVLTLVAISIERYYAIVHPLSAMKVNSKSRTRKIIALTWVIPIVVASPYVFCQSYAFTIYSELGSISRQICADRFDEIDRAIHGEDTDKIGEFRKGYFLFLFCIIYLLPSIVIFTTCIIIAVSLLQPIVVDDDSSMCGGHKDTSRRHEENKRKVARMVVVIAITFVVSWSPLYIVSVVSQLQEVSFLRESNFIFTMLVTHFFGFLNSCLNPIIYTAMSQKFRRSFKEILQRLFFCCAHSSALPYRPSHKHGGSSHRFTSTVRQTLSDAAANQIAMQDGRAGKEVYFVGKGRKGNNSRSSSSGAESDLRTYQSQNGHDPSKVMKVYIFKNNTYGSGTHTRGEEDLFDKPLIGGHESELKGILKNSRSGETFIEDMESPIASDTNVKDIHGNLEVTYN